MSLKQNYIHSLGGRRFYQKRKQIKVHMYVKALPIQVSSRVLVCKHNGALIIRRVCSSVVLTDVNDASKSYTIRLKRSFMCFTAFCTE